MHSHSHHHSHGSTSRIGWVFVLNLSFTFVEFIGGLLTNSTAIMANAIHDLGDSLSIGLSWFLAKVSNKPANSSYSYGFKRFSLLGSLINGIILIVGAVWVLLEAIPRLYAPETPSAQGMFALAILGVIINGVAAYKLSGGKTLNERMINWHLLEDVLGWVVVLVVSIVLMFIELPILDPILSIVFTLFIMVNVFKNLTTTARIFLQAEPQDGLKEEIINKLMKLPEISQLHHVHLWSLDGEHHVLTLHVVLDKYVCFENLIPLKNTLSNTLSGFGLSHTTIEFEFHNELCRHDSSSGFIHRVSEYRCDN